MISIMNDLDINPNQTNPSLQTEAALINPLQKRVTVLYFIVGILILIAITSLLMVLKTGTKNDDQNDMVAEKNDLQVTNNTPTLTQQPSPVTQPSVANQLPTPVPFNYSFMSPDEFKTKVTNYLISKNSNEALRKETKVLLEESMIKYSTMDVFSKWLITACPYFDINNIDSKVLPFRVPDSHRVRCSLSNVIFNPQLSFFSIVPQKEGVFVFVLGPEAEIDGQLYFDYKQAISTLNEIPTINGVKVEIKYFDEWADDKRQYIAYPRLFAYKNYKEYMVVGINGSNKITIKTVDLFKYPNIDETNKLIIDDLVNAVNLVKPI